MENSLPVLAILIGSTLMRDAFGQPPDSGLALVGGTVWVDPTEAPIRDGVVLIQGGRIAAVNARARVQIPKGARTLDCSGLTIMAGLWNSHVHFFERKWANAAAIPAPELDRQIQDMLTRYGFTTVFDLGSTWENTRRIRDRIESGELPGPGIRSTGEVLLPKDGLPPDAVLNTLGVMKTGSHEVADAAQASSAARKVLDQGVDGLKLFASAQSKISLPEGAMQAAVTEAHRSGKPVFVHPNNGADVLAALRGGVDIIAHTTPYSGAWDEAVLAAIRERRAALTPTLKIWMEFMRHDRISVQDKTAATGIGQLKAWVAGGGTVLFGTDISYVDYDPAEEYRLMAEAMTFPQILASLTTAPAGRFGDSRQLGRIAAGFQADLVAVKDDPAKDIRALAAVRYTVRGGKIIYRAAE